MSAKRSALALHAALCLGAVAAAAFATHALAGAAIWLGPV